MLAHKHKRRLGFLRRGCVAEVPCLTLPTCRIAFSRSICSQRRSTSSEARDRAGRSTGPWWSRGSPAVVLGGLNQPLDLTLGQMLTGPIGGVGFPHRQSNCAFLRWPARPLSDARMTAISCPAFARAFLAVFGLVSARSAPAGRQECARYATSTGEMGFGDQFVAMSATGRVNAN